jgi:hypothetical protein
MQEWELGVAWMPEPQWEVTMEYAFTERRNVFSTTPAANATTPGQQFDAYGNLIPPAELVLELRSRRTPLKTHDRGTAWSLDR